MAKGSETKAGSDCPAVPPHCETRELCLRVCSPHGRVQAEADAVRLRLRWRVLQGWLGGTWVSPVATALRCQPSHKCSSTVAARQPDGRGWEAYQLPDSHQSRLMTQFSFGWYLCKCARSSGSAGIVAAEPLPPSSMRSGCVLNGT